MGKIEGEGVVYARVAGLFFSSHPAADGWQTHPTYFLLGFSAALAPKFTFCLLGFSAFVAQPNIMTTPLFYQRHAMAGQFGTIVAKM